MKPLSPLAYYRRHMRGTVLLIALVALATVGVCFMARLLDVAVEQSRLTTRYLSRVSVVSALKGSLDPGLVARIRAHPGVARTMPARELSLDVPNNYSGGFRVFGLPEGDMTFFAESCSLRLREGRFPRPRSNEIALSWELAAALGLRLGDPLGRSIDERYYGAFPTTMVLVGLLENDPSTAAQAGIRLGLASYEYLQSHERYTAEPSSAAILSLPQPSGLLVVAQAGRKGIVDRFLELNIPSAETLVLTEHLWEEQLATATSFMDLLFGVVGVLVSAVVAVVVAVINRLKLSQRLSEVGLLYALGYGKGRLVLRLTLETALVAVLGWVVGLALSWGLFAWGLRVLVGPSMDLDLGNLRPLWLALPIPLLVGALVAWTTARALRRMDAVAIIERGKLVLEADPGLHKVRRSLARPLSAWTFYLRHRRRGVGLLVAMMLMILGVAFPVLVISPMTDVQRLLFNHLRYVSIVRPHTGGAVDPGLVAQIRTHPAVARVILGVELRLTVSAPPVNRYPARLYGVAEQDLPAMLDAYGLVLERGRLPTPRSDEIVVTQAVAMNRGLDVGGVVGRPVNEDDVEIPTEMVVVGILSRPGGGQRTLDLWTGFASYEYLRAHERYAGQPVSLLLLAAEGRQEELDTWLRHNVNSEQTDVITYADELSFHERMTRLMLVVVGLAEGGVALVAALALAVLSYIYYTQRRDEFGTLHALGHSRRWLVRRTVGESGTIVGVAWLTSVLICLAGLTALQRIVYAPMGLAVNLLNPTHWLFTLPTPLAVISVSAGLVVWMLSRLDPVAIIEGRS